LKHDIHKFIHKHKDIKMSNFLNVSPSPHIKGTESVDKLMYGVIFAMLPALAVSVYFFGLGALYVTLVSVASAMMFEFLIVKYLLKQRPTLTDGSAALTGLLLAFNVPTHLPIHILLIGSLVAIGIAKMSFGGLGQNPLNPALVGRVFLLISFPVDMTKWPLPNPMYFGLDATTGATPLAIVKEGLRNGESFSSLLDKLPSTLDLFIGYTGGSMGEISAVALLLGGVYMLFRKIITWHIPVSIFATIAVFTGILWAVNPEHFAPPMFHLLTGGVVLGAIYMATDMVTSPMSTTGQLVYGVGIGLLTVIIRVWGAYPEGISFAILLMNIYTTLINRYIKPKRFGEVQK
jgi:electron transport complex protein RnfD